MRRQKLIVMLNRFLALEMQQVALYRRQAQRTADPHLARALQLFALIEDGHVKNLRREIKRLGGNFSYYIGASDNVGDLLGWASRVPGISPMLRLNVIIEGRAARDYAGLIANVAPGPTREMLWQHQLEEELHKAWMESYLRQRIGKRGKAKQRGE
jgi:bacterioferritin (cytochrome b1)